MKTKILLIALLISKLVSAQTFSGKVYDESQTPLENVKILIVEDNITIYSGYDGSWSITSGNSSEKTIVFKKNGYTYEQFVNQVPATNLSIKLRTEVKSAATLREENYIQNNCSGVNVPDDYQWNAEFEITQLKGDLAPNSTYTRRDPSGVIKVDDTYFMWYSYSLTFDYNKLAPWDLNDIYYASSADGITWTEHGKAVGRGEAGSFDARSVFTTEIFVNDGTYYLVYQAAADENGIYDRNTVGMATATSPYGPWTKLAEPVLRPTYTNDYFFDNNAVHDPCIISYNNKFYLYYKGECRCQTDGCNDRWCSPICGLQKQVKWGVAIADSPTGPYVKSSSNPITNTGHEVMVWPYKEGVAILQHQDGPEPNSIQFAENGLDFEIKGKVTNIPEAAGLYRNEKSETNPQQGIKWGVGHKLMWNAGPKGWMYIYRFDNVNKTTTSIPEKKKTKLKLFCSSGELMISGLQTNYKLSIYSLDGKLVKKAEVTGEEKINVTSVEKGVYCVKISTENEIYSEKIFIN